MCGRDVRRSDKQKLAEHFRAQPTPADPGCRLQPSSVNAPADHPAKQRNCDRELILARWGLVPFFTKDLKNVKGLSTINAGSERGRLPGSGEPAKAVGKRTMSEAGRARIASAQKKRWAKCRSVANAA